MVPLRRFRRDGFHGRFEAEAAARLIWLDVASGGDTGPSWTGPPDPKGGAQTYGAASDQPSETPPTTV